MTSHQCSVSPLPQTQPPWNQQDQAGRSGFKATILVVDDTPDVLRFLSDRLREAGYEVCSAISGPIALNAVHTIQPDLILLDVMLPGLDGYEVCERLKSDPRTGEIPVIFVSALHEGIDKVRAFGMGGADYVTKPFCMDELLVRLEYHLSVQRSLHCLRDHNQHLTEQVAQQHQQVAATIALLDQAPVGLFQSTVDGRILWANWALAQMCGYDSMTDLVQSVNHMGLSFYVRPQRHGELVAYLRQYGYIREFESQIYHRNGSRRWISVTARAVQDEDGYIQFYEGMVHDISDRRYQEQQACLATLRQERATQLVLAIAQY